MIEKEKWRRIIISCQLRHLRLMYSIIYTALFDLSVGVSPQVRLNLGMYIVFLLDWLTVFQREQILVLRLEDYADNLKVTLRNIFDFLSVGKQTNRDILLNV